MINLQKPPIVEAAIEIRYADNKNIKEFYNLLIEKYKNEKYTISDIVQTQFSIEPGSAEKPEVKTNPQIKHGYRINLEDKNIVLQATGYQFSVSKVGNYTNWEDFYGNLEKNVKIFENYNNLDVNRLGVRFINKFIAPIDGIENYINMVPYLPPGKIDVAITSATQQFKLSAQEINSNATVNINLRVVNINNEKKLEILLDIDVFKVKQIGTIEELKIEAEKLRFFKNDIFKANVGNQAMETFQ